MGKATRIRQQSAREKIAAQQAAARRAEARRRLLLVGGSVAAVIVIVAALVVVKLASGPAKTGSATGTAQASVARSVTSVPAATLDAVGKGAIYPTAIQPIRTSAAPLTSGGQPQVVYVGAEYCPYCAAERWAMTVALSRFGAFSGLRFIHSSPTDVDPNTPTLTFYKASYTSKYLAFTTTEAETVSRAPLQKLTSLDTALMARYDAPPYVQSATDDGSFPFVDIGNKYVIVGASYDPQVLKGMTWAQVAAAIKDPSSPVGAAVGGTANAITAAICKVTNGKPGSVCTSAAVKAANGDL